MDTPDLAAAIKEIVSLATASQQFKIETISPPEGFVDGLPAFVPVGFVHGQSAPLDLAKYFEPYRIHPRAKVGTAKVQSLASFIDLVNRHRVDESVIFADCDWRKPSLTAVIDYHEESFKTVWSADGDLVQEDAPGTPGFGRHRIHYAFPLSDPWQLWVAGDAAAGRKYDQREFAELVEDRIADFSAPFDSESADLERKFGCTVAAPADLLTLSRGLQVHVESKVGQEVKLQSGEGRITWQEVHKDADGAALVVPGLFILAVAPFFGGVPVRVPVRLRYRAQKGGAITWFYQIYRPDLAITERITEDLDLVATRTGLPVYAGTPEMSGAPG